MSGAPAGRARRATVAGALIAVGTLAGLAPCPAAALTPAAAVARATPAPGTAPTPGSARASGMPPATLITDRRCYVVSGTVPQMTVTGTGFTPGAPVLITGGADIDVDTTANANGDIVIRMSAPTPRFRAPGSRTLTLTARQASSAIVATTTTRVTQFSVLHGATRPAPGLAALNERTSWSFAGFAPGRTVYAHYTLKGRQVAEQAFGRAAGPCGLLRARARLLPIAPTTSSYPVQYDSVRTYSARTRPRLTGRVSLQLQS